MNDQETDDHRHSSEMQHPRGLEAAKQRNQAGELDRLPDGEAGDDLGDAGEDDDDVEQLLHRIVDGDVLVRDLEMQRVDDGLHHLGWPDRQQLLAQAPGREAVDQIDQPVESEEPHAGEMPVEAPGRPVTEPPERAEMEAADDHVVVVDAPTRRDHDQHDHGVDPVHDPDGQGCKRRPGA